MGKSWSVSSSSSWDVMCFLRSRGVSSDVRLKFPIFSLGRSIGISLCVSLVLLLVQFNLFSA